MATETAPGLVERLQQSPQRLADSIRASAMWLAVVDGPLDVREFHEVSLVLVHEPEGLALQDIADAFGAEPFPRDLPRLFRFLRAQRTPLRTASLLDIYIRVVASDGQISQVERHALMFLSDLLAAPATLLRERFEALLGFEFEPPDDLSDPAFFEAAEAVARVHEARARQRDSSAAAAKQQQAERLQALQVLDLKPDATPIAIKAAWRRLSRKFHPDRQGGSAEDIAATTEQFHAVQEAWRLLAEARDA